MYCQRPYSIRTRIKTLMYRLQRSISLSQRPYSIRTRIKTGYGIGVFDFGPSQRPYSIRTRIKTLLDTGVLMMPSSCQRPYSIRTRIKTISLSLLSIISRAVRDHIPLEQGLRLPESYLSCTTRLSETIFH